MKILFEQYRNEKDELIKHLTLTNINYQKYIDDKKLKEKIDILKDVLKNKIKIKRELQYYNKFEMYNEMLYLIKKQLDNIEILNKTNNEELLILLQLTINDNISTMLDKTISTNYIEEREINFNHGIFDLICDENKKELKQLVKNNKFIDKKLWKSYIQKINNEQSITKNGVTKHFIIPEVFTPVVISPEKEEEFVYEVECQNEEELLFSYLGILFSCPNNFFVACCNKCSDLFVTENKKERYCKRLDSHGLTCAEQVNQFNKSRESRTIIQKMEKDIARILSNKSGNNNSYGYSAEYYNFFDEKEKKKQLIKSNKLTERAYFDWLNSFYSTEKARERHIKEYKQYKK